MHDIGIRGCYAEKPARLPLVAGYSATEYEANADKLIIADDRQGQLTWAFSVSRW